MSILKCMVEWSNDLYVNPHLLSNLGTIAHHNLQLGILLGGGGTFIYSAILPYSLYLKSADFYSFSQYDYKRTKNVETKNIVGIKY